MPGARGTLNVPFASVMFSLSPLFRTRGEIAGEEAVSLEKLVLRAGFGLSSNCIESAESTGSAPSPSVFGLELRPAAANLSRRHLRGVWAAGLSGQQRQQEVVIKSPLSKMEIDIHVCDEVGNGTRDCIVQ